MRPIVTIVGVAMTLGALVASDASMAAKPRKSATNSGKARKEAPAKARKETSTDVKKQEQAAEREIQNTREEIRRNDERIRSGLASLERLRGEVETSRKAVTSIQAQVADLNTRIATLEGNIAKGEDELARLREEYLKAIKKMRLTRKNQSALAFLFASENFNQALRRMRYLKQFSEWKDKQSSEINAKIAELRRQGELLTEARNSQSIALRKEQQARATLEARQKEQDAVVAELRRNGQALNEHLSRKQAEANALRSRVAALIAAEEQARRQAEEQKRREAEERKKREAEAEARRAAEAKAKREREAQLQKERDEAIRRAEEAKKAEEAAKKAEAERIEAERQAKADAAKKAEAKAKAKAAEEARRKADEARKAAEKAARDKEKKRAEEEKAAREKEKKAQKERKHTHTDARRRKAKTEKPNVAVSKPATAPAASASPSTGGNFESMRGSLPRPVAGHFKVTSPFGRHALPGLPDVQYDNPGIDAQVSAGATARAVFGGKVSGIYAVPGFGTVVIVSHGNYYTVYGNLASTQVKVGDNVKSGQGLGTVAKDADNSSYGSLHFEVWRNREKQNPMSWIQ